ncbi:MAG: prepilin-type N-terminal cleavage/methylation domain-containing protein [Candidatus Zixiibacteriota bacterium]|nr:MAG: prepilin-type N-terminal cleavage/methylation domain-containing protein [candidate division Zixibacteria bacterium]
MRNRGYTLIEMILVVVIIGILASVAIQSLSKTEDSRRLDETMAEIEDIARAIAGDERLISDGVRTDFGYVGDIGSLPSNLDGLVANPGGYATWKGPYIRNKFNENSEDYRRDAWDNLYTYAGGIVVVSNADGNPITKQFAASAGDLTSNTIKGVVRDKAGLPPSDSASHVNVTVYYPDGSGSMTSSTTSPVRSGEFSFDNQIPIGIHFIRAVDLNAGDTASKYLAVNPGSITLTELRMPSELWGSSGGETGGLLEYVSGSARVYGPGNRNIRFEIFNSGSDTVTVNFAVLIYNVIPDAYYQKLIWSGIVIYNNPRLGSGDILNFPTPETIGQSETLTIEYESFWDSPATGGSFVNMSGIDFQAVFSSGDTVSFATP